MARVKSQKSQKRRKTFVRFLPIYILMLPGLIYLFINNYMPLPGLVIAFKQYNATILPGFSRLTAVAMAGARPWAASIQSISR